MLSYRPVRGTCARVVVAAGYNGVEGAAVIRTTVPALAMTHIPGTHVHTLANTPSSTTLPRVVSTHMQHMNAVRSLCGPVPVRTKFSLQVNPSTTAMYMQLGKARLSALVVATSTAGFLLAGPPQSLVALGSVTLGTTLAALAANTFNQVYERNTDRLMGRTCGRPLPSGRMTPGHAMGFGTTMAALSAAVLSAGTNPLTTMLGLSNIILYSMVYTPMKQVSKWNTAVGAIVGAIPPIMGLTAATGMIPCAESLVIGGTLFFWQFPHFYALAWMSRKDYAAGGHEMLPVLDKTGGHDTARAMMMHSVALTALPLAASVIGVTSPMYAVVGASINGYVTYLCSKFAAKPSDGNARRVFRATLWVLPVSLVTLILYSHNWDSKPAHNSLDNQQAPDELHGSAAVSGDDHSSPEAPQPVGDKLATKVANVRGQLRAVCPHEVLKDDPESATSLAGETSAKSADAGAGSSATSGSSGSFGSSGTPGLSPSSSHMKQASSGSVDGRAACPVTVIEDAVHRVTSFTKPKSLPTASPTAAAVESSVESVGVDDSKQ